MLGYTAISDTMATPAPSSATAYFAAQLPQVITMQAAVADLYKIGA